jgi:hypothetical protein
MSSFKLEQRRLTLRGREFHFVSYEGQLANPARHQTATAPTWFLMNAGKRWPVIPHQPGQEIGELDRLLAQWLEQHVFV